MSRKKWILAGISLPVLFLFLSQLGNTILGVGESLFGLKIPEWAYGLLSLVFLAGFVWSWLKGER